jgi:hypothetical protein
MAAIDFPNSPTLNQMVQRGGYSWQWNGTVWKKVVVAGTAFPNGTNNLDLIKWNASTEGWESDTQANVIGAYVSGAINEVIDAAPASLNTLNELAAALNDDANFATTVTNAIAEKPSTGKAIAMALVFGG